MNNDLYTIIEFDENDKWFVIGATVWNNDRYNYLVKLTPDEEDFTSDFMVVKCILNQDNEYFKMVEDKNLLREIVPKLIDETEDLLKNPKETLKELMKY